MEIVDVNFNFDLLKEVIWQRRNNFFQLSEQWKKELDDHVKLAKLAENHELYKKDAVAAYYKAQETEKQVKAELKQCINDVELLLKCIQTRICYFGQNPSDDYQTSFKRIGETLMLDEDKQFYKELEYKCILEMKMLFPDDAELSYDKEVERE